MKLEISCEHLHCGHTSLLGIKGSVGKFSCSMRESSEPPQGISKIRLSVCMVQFTLLAVETFAYQLSESHPEFSASTPQPTIPSGSRRCRERIIPRILLRISHSFIFRVSGAAKVSSEGSFSIILVLLVATSFEFCDSILVAFAMTS